MARRKSVALIRDVGVDARYGSELVQKFINILMWRGKKSAARTIMYDALDLLVKKAGGDREKGLGLLEKALENTSPLMEVRPRRVGGSVYQVPVEVPARRARSLAIRALILAAKGRKDKTMGIRLGYEAIAASENQGNAVKKRVDTHRMAEANKAFAHYAW
jgi:small subunit ribosomal protein S7